jgi:hypothetical protein
MAIKHYISFSLVFLATTTVFLHGHAHSLCIGKCDLYRKANYKPLYRSIVRGRSDPRAALESAIYQLIFKSRRAMRLADRLEKSQYAKSYKENFDNAIYNLNTCLQNLKKCDKASLNINLSAALNDYVTCDDTFSESGRSNPFRKTDALLRHMASNYLYLSTLIR